MLRVQQSPAAAALINNTFRTDPNGRFEIPGLPKGTLTLAIESPRYGRQQRQVEVLANDSTEVVIELDEVRAHRLRGQVWMEGLGPGGGVSVYAYDPDSGLAHKTIADADGWFDFDQLPAARYRLEVRSRLAISALEGRNVTLDGDVLDWRVVAHPATSQ